MRALALMFVVALGACGAPTVSLTRLGQVEVRGPVELHLTFAAGSSVAWPEGLQPDLDGRLVIDASSPRLLELTVPQSVEVVARAGAHVTVQGDRLATLTLRAPGGTIDGHVDVDSLHVDGASGSVTLDGRARVLELTGDGLSFDGARLATEVARVDLGGGGRARVKARQVVTGAVRGGVLQVVGPARVEVLSRGGAVETVTAGPATQAADDLRRSVSVTQVMLR